MTSNEQVKPNAIVGLTEWCDCGADVRKLTMLAFLCNTCGHKTCARCVEYTPVNMYGVKEFICPTCRTILVFEPVTELTMLED